MAGSAWLVAAWSEAVGAVVFALGDLHLALSSSQFFGLLEEELAVRLQVRLDGGGVCTRRERGAQFCPDCIQPGRWWWRFRA
jgi:hypothetical protein